MSYTQYQTEKGPQKKWVKYTGSDVLYPGYALQYNRDSTTAKAATVSETDNYARAYEVEKPAGGEFAGVVADGRASYQGPCWLQIVEPDGLGRVCNAYVGVATTVAVTDLGVGSTYVLAAASSTVPAVARALVTDSSATAKSREVVLFPRHTALSPLYNPPTGGTTGGTYAITGTTVQAPVDIKRLAKILNNVISGLKQAGIMKQS